MNERFRKIAQAIADAMGTAWAFIIAFAIVVSWGFMGPGMQFSDKWLLMINSFATIVTFLMVFLIQNSQNRQLKATQLKLDELIHKLEGPRSDLVGLEYRTDAELSELKHEKTEEIEREAGQRRDQEE